MKNFTTILLFSLSAVLFSSTLFAQNYSTVNFGNPAMFRSELNNNQIFFNQVADYYTWSRLKITRISSVITSPTEIHYYTFKTWRDTATVDTNCGFWDGPSWMGNEIVESNNGFTYLFNEAGDTIAVNQNANVGQSWVLYRFSNGAEIRATVNAVSVMTVASLTDSVKEILLEAFDSLGQSNPSHPANNIMLSLSQNNGWFRTVSVREFPSMVLLLVRNDPIQFPEYKDIYDFEIGDEFEYMGQCINLGGSFPPGYSYVRIDDKWMNATLDTVSYKRSVLTLDLQFNSFPTPHLDSTFTYREDTVSYFYSNAPLYPTVPEENNTLLHQSYLNPVNCYTMDQDSSLYNNRLIFHETEGYFDLDNSSTPCIHFNHFEPLDFNWDYSPGLGLVATQFNAMSQAGDNCEQHLIWFHKGTETWGNYVPLTSGIKEMSSSILFDILPNPAGKNVRVNFLNQFPEHISILSSDGKLIKTLNANDKTVSIDLSDLSAGIYILSVEGKNSIQRKKLIHFTENK